MNCTLLENGLDYILHSCENLNIIENRVTTVPDNSLAYKYLVRDLISGVEIIFKYRLQLDNWTFIVEKLDVVTIDKFQKGDFQSIGLEEAIKRLKNLCNVDIRNQDKENYKELKKIRNMIEHFHFIVTTDQEKINFAILINNCLSAIINFIDGDELNFEEKFTTVEKGMYEEIKENLGNLGEFLVQRYDEIIALYPNNNFVRCPNCQFVCLDIREDKDTNKCLLCLHEKEKLDIATAYIDSAVSYRDIAQGAEPLCLYDCPNCGSDGMMTVDYEENKTICFDCGNVVDISEYEYCSECNKPMNKDCEMCICEDCLNYKIENSD